MFDLKPLMPRQARQRSRFARGNGIWTGSWLCRSTRRWSNHGVGFVKGTPEQNETICSRLAVELHALVVSEAYSLAPTFPFRGALSNGFRAAEWCVANARGLGSDRKRMAVAGHDAGSSLAAGLAAMACDQAEFRLRHRRCLRHCSIQT